jgi:hypothetical protein
MKKTDKGLKTKSNRTEFILIKNTLIILKEKLVEKDLTIFRKECIFNIFAPYLVEICTSTFKDFH